MESAPLQIVRGAVEGEAVAVYLRQSAVWGVGNYLQKGRFDPTVGFKGSCTANVQLMGIIYLGLKRKRTQRELPV